MAKFNSNDYADFLLDELYHQHYFEYLEIMNKELEGMSATTERINRKAVARNRHHTSEKAKKRAKKSADILEKRYQNFRVGTSYEEYRLYSRKAAAAKKVARVKTA